jgi:hypothetical protein
VRNYDDIASELRVATLALARGLIDDMVQCNAINALARDYASTRDDEVCAVLASVVKDQAASTCVRFLAYATLFEVSGRGVSECPPVELFCSDPPIIDWNFVNRWA